MISTASQAWLQPIRSCRSPQLRVIAIPHAGGWPSTFHPWSAQLPEGVEMVVAQLPGRGARLYEEPFLNVDDIVEAFLGTLHNLIHTPYILLGHSFGSIICFELARQLRRWGFPPPKLLIASAHQAPHLPRKPPFIHHLSDSALRAYLSRIGGLPDAIIEREELLRFVLRTVRADFQALETYHYYPECVLDTPIYACAALDDPIVVPTTLLGWSEHTSHMFQTHWMQGGHFYMYQPGNVQRLIELLQPFIASASIVPRT